MMSNKLDLKPSLTKADLRFEAVIKSKKYTNDRDSNPPFEAPDGIKYYIEVYKHKFYMMPTDEFLRLEYNRDRNLGFYFYSDDLPDDVEANPWVCLKKYWNQPVWRTGIAQLVTYMCGSDDEGWEPDIYTDYHYSRDDTTRRTIPGAILKAMQMRKEKQIICVKK